MEGGNWCQTFTPDTFTQETTSDLFSSQPSSFVTKTLQFGFLAGMLWRPSIDTKVYQVRLSQTQRIRWEHLAFLYTELPLPLWYSALQLISHPIRNKNPWYISQDGSTLLTEHWKHLHKTVTTGSATAKYISYVAFIWFSCISVQPKIPFFTCTVLPYSICYSIQKCQLCFNLLYLPELSQSSNIMATHIMLINPLSSIYLRIPFHITTYVFFYNTPLSCLFQPWQSFADMSRLVFMKEGCVQRTCASHAYFIPGISKDSYC